MLLAQVSPFLPTRSLRHEARINVAGEEKQLQCDGALDRPNVVRRHVRERAYVAAFLAVPVPHLLGVAASERAGSARRDPPDRQYERRRRGRSIRSSSPRHAARQWR